MRQAVLVVAVVAATLAACAYKPGPHASSSRELAGQRTTVGCLDLAIDRRADIGSSAVLGYTFGNRCDEPAMIDLSWAHVIGRTADGAEIALTPYDPHGSLRPLELGGRGMGAETLSYPANQTLGQVCVDVASLAQTRPSQWLCFGNPQAMARVAPRAPVTLASIAASR
jgi:hypothetical protein